MLLNVNELLISLSKTLDFAEKEVLSNNENHGMRVAYISARIARSLSMSDRHLFDLISYALLHDNGVMASVRYSSSQSKAEAFSVEMNSAHCLEGEKNIQTFPFLSRQKNVLLYHHEHYDGSGFFGISGNRIPLYSRIIALADFMAIRYSLGQDCDGIVRAVKQNKRYFDPTVCEAMLELSSHLEFWLDMDDMFVKHALISMMPRVIREFDYKQIRSISQMFSRVIDAKSPFTGSHSRGISEKTGFICQYYEFDETTYWQMRIAADLHDLGKLAVPNSILDKPGRLNAKEFRVIQAHPYYTRKIIETIKGFENITEWASNHHEKLNGSGYPYGLTADRLDFNSRILACVDIYQALTENRPYRKGMSHTTAIHIMQGMVKENLIEPSVTEDMNSIFKDE